jgi:hypothetical protein
LLANNAVELTELQLFEAEIDGLETGILWLNVEETDILRKIHTVAIGDQPIEIYRKIKEEFSDRLINLQYPVREPVMFVYDDMFTMNAGYMTYMILPLDEGR